MNYASLFASTFRIALPLLLAALGILLSSKSGIINLGMEGNMMFSAFFGVVAAYYTGSAWIGMLCAIASAVVFSLLFGYFVIRGKADQVVCGIGFNFFAAGTTAVMLSALLNTKNVTPLVARLPAVNLPVIGETSISIFIALVVLVATWFLLERTNFGLRIRAIGENPAAADALGVNVEKYQFIAMILVGVLAGLAGAELTLGQLGYFSRGITASRGYMAFSIVVLGAYNPLYIVFASIFIGFIDAFQIRAQSFFNLPGQFFIILPYLLTIVALVFGKKMNAPAHEGKPYNRE